MNKAVEGETSVADLLSASLRSDTRPAEFIEVLLPALSTRFSERTRRLFAAELDVGIVVSGQYGGRWLLHLGEDGVLHAQAVSDAEGVPLVTLLIDEEDWFGIRDFLGDFEEELLDWLSVEPPAPVRRFDSALLSRTEALDVALRVELARFFSDASARFLVRFNGWTPSAAAEIGIGLSVDDLEDLLDGALGVREAMDERRFRMDGDVGALMPLSGLLAAMYPSTKRRG